MPADRYRPVMADGRARARPEISKQTTKLARRRLKARYTQKEMAQLTGMSLMTYRRIERAELDNPPLRHLVNCLWVLRVRLPDTRFGDILEPQWLDWLPLNDEGVHPPQPPPPREPYELFSE